MHAGARERFFAVQGDSRIELLNFRLRREGVPVHRQQDGEWEFDHYSSDEVVFEAEEPLPDNCAVETSMGRRFQLAVHHDYERQTLLFAYSALVRGDAFGRRRPHGP